MSKRKKTYAVLCTVTHTYSLRGIKARDEEAAIALVKALELDQFERYGHEIDCEVVIDSVAWEPVK